jgi:hypothetical protein
MDQSAGKDDYRTVTSTACIIAPCTGEPQSGCRRPGPTVLFTSMHSNSVGSADYGSLEKKQIRLECPMCSKIVSHRTRHPESACARYAGKRKDVLSPPSSRSQGVQNSFAKNVMDGLLGVNILETRKRPGAEHERK